MTVLDVPAQLDQLRVLREAIDRASSDTELAELTQRLVVFARRLRLQTWQPYPWQHPHVHPPGWASTRAPGVCDERCALLPVATIPTMGTWLETGGRGTGKTEGLAHYVNDHVNGPPCDTRPRGGHRLTIIAPTQADAVTSCVTGVSGLQMVDPGITVSTTNEGTLVRFPNGSEGRVVGAHTPNDLERLRAWTNVCCVWIEEAGAMRYLESVLDLLPFSMRLGPRPHRVASTTPRPRKGYKTLRDAESTIVTRGRTRDADRLDPSVRAELEKLFAGTTLGRQELDAEDIEDVPGSLWVVERPEVVDGIVNPDQRPGITNDSLPPGAVGWTPRERPAELVANAARYSLALPEAPLLPPAPTHGTVTRTVVTCDPPGGRTEAGITVEGSISQHGYTLADLSLAAPPNTWALLLVCAYYDYGAEGLVIEQTYGGDMVPNTVGTLCTLLGIPTPPIFRAKTKVGKRLRAEPVQALYQQHRWHHVGYHAGLVAEQTTWVPSETKDSPNRIDAHVHGATYLQVSAGPGQVSNPARAQTQMPNTHGGSLGRR